MFKNKIILSTLIVMMLAACSKDPHELIINSKDDLKKYEKEISELTDTQKDMLKFYILRIDSESNSKDTKTKAEYGVSIKKALEIQEDYIRENKRVDNINKINQEDIKIEEEKRINKIKFVNDMVNLKLIDMYESKDRTGSEVVDKINTIYTIKNNNLEKNIIALKGRVIFYDKFNDEIFVDEVKMDLGKAALLPKATTSIKEVKTITSQKIKDFIAEDKSEYQYKFEIDKIIFNDNTEIDLTEK